MPWRDIKLYLQALAKHLVWLIAAGPGAAVVLLLWSVFLKTNIPATVFWIAALAGFPVAGFLAWRDEHRKVHTAKETDPEIELRRPRFEKEIAKLSPEQEAVLRFVVQVGDTHAMQLRDRFFRDQGKSVSARDADLLLLGIAETTGLLEHKETGTAFPRYGVKSVWTKLLVEWAVPPTAVDRRIADKAEALRRPLTAGFEQWRAGPQKLGELTTWAGSVLRGCQSGEDALKEIVELRTDASRRIERVVGKARDAYYAAADIIGRLFKGGGLSIDENNRQAVDTQLREAVAHMEECLAALDLLTRDSKR